MVNVEKLRVTDAAGLAAIAMTTADMIVVVDRSSVIANGTCPTPSASIDGQIFIVTVRLDITSLAMDFGAKTNYSAVTKVLGGTSVGWVFDTAANAWFAYGNTVGNPLDLQILLGSKAPLANPTFTGTVAGVTAAMVGLGSVNNTADSAKPISTAQQAALDTKLGVGTVANLVYSRITGSAATTTGQTLVDITNGSTPLSNALVANAVYEFEAVMSCTVSAVTTGITYGVNFSAAGATIEAHITGASSTTATKAERISAFNTNTTAFMATSAQAGGITIKGIIVTGANAGNLTIMHRKVTSGTSSVLPNSFLKTIRIS